MWNTTWYIDSEIGDQDHAPSHTMQFNPLTAGAPYIRIFIFY